ncbi:MAG: hypothetical protein V3U55_10945 [Mycobacterium sp.]
MRFHGEDEALFGFRLLDGRLREEPAECTWSLKPPHATTDGQVP